MRNAKEVLSSFLNESQLLKAGEITDFFSSWKTVAGENLAAHSRIREYEKGIVFVETDHPGWIQLLKMQEKRIYSVLRQRYPALDIKGVRFFLSAEGEQRESVMVSPAGYSGGSESDDNAEKTENKQPDADFSHDKKAFMERLARLGENIRNNPGD